MFILESLTKEMMHTLTGGTIEVFLYPLCNATCRDNYVSDLNIFGGQL